MGSGNLFLPHLLGPGERLQEQKTAHLELKCQRTGALNELDLKLIVAAWNQIRSVEMFDKSTNSWMHVDNLPNTPNPHYLALLHLSGQHFLHQIVVILEYRNRLGNIVEVKVRD